MRDVATFVTCSLGLVACAGTFSPVRQVETYLPAGEAERRLEEAFTYLGLPVVERARDGRVRSGRFDPVAVWGAASGYVLCGRGGDDDLGAREVRLEVIGSIRESVSSPARVEIESYGTGRNDKGEEIPCRLDDSGVDVLLSSIPQRQSTRGSRVRGATTIDDLLGLRAAVEVDSPESREDRAARDAVVAGWHRITT